VSADNSRAGGGCLAVLVWGLLGAALAFGLGATVEHAALWGVAAGIGCPVLAVAFFLLLAIAGAFLPRGP
jgi:hypothetical protein